MSNFFKHRFRSASALLVAVLMGAALIGPAVAPQVLSIGTFTAYAQSGTSENFTAGNATDTSCSWWSLRCWVPLTIGYIMSAVIFAAASLLTVFVWLLIKVASYNGFISEPVVVLGWNIVRDVANMFFVLLLLLISFGTIFRLPQYQLKSLLPKVILMAFLVNFSKTIAGLLIDFSQVVMLTFVAAINEVGPGNILDVLNLDDLSQFAGQAVRRDQSFFSTEGAASSLAIGPAAIATTYLFALVVVLIACIVVLLLLLFLVVRMVALWVLVIFSPFAYLLSVVPQGAKYASQWWDQFTKYLITGPIMAFLLWLALATLPTITTDEQGGLSKLFVGPPEQGEVLPNATPVGLSAGTPDKLIGYIVSIVMLMMSIVVAKSVGDLVGKAAGSAYGSITSKGVKFAKGVGGLAASPFQRVYTRAVNSDTTRGALLTLSKTPGFRNLAINSQRALGAPGRKLEDEAEKFAKTLAPDFAQSYVFANRRSNDPVKKARIDAIKKRMPHLIPDASPDDATGISKFKAAIPGFQRKDLTDPGYREFQRFVGRALDEGVDLFDPRTGSPGIVSIATDPKAREWRQKLYDVLDDRGKTGLIPGTPEFAPMRAIATAQSLPKDLSKKYQAGASVQSDSERLANLTRRAIEQGGGEQEFYKPGGRYEQNKNLYMSRDALREHESASAAAQATAASGGAPATLRAGTVIVQGGDIRVGGKGAEDAKQVTATHQAFIGSLLSRPDGDQEYEDKYTRTRSAILDIAQSKYGGTSSEAMRKAHSEFYGQQGVYETSPEGERREQFLDAAEYGGMERLKTYDPKEVELGHFKTYIGTREKPGANAGESPDRVRLAADFSALDADLDADAHGVNLTGAEKDLIVPRIVSLVREQDKKKEIERSEEQYSAMEAKLRDASVLHLDNRRVQKSLDARKETLVHEDFHDKISGVDTGKLRSLWQGMNEERKQRIRAMLQSFWGIGVGEEDEGRAMEEFFAESLKNATPVGERVAAATEEKIRAAYGGSAEQFYASDEYRKEQERRKVTGQRSLLSRGEYAMRQVLQLNDDEQKAFAEMGVLQQTPKGTRSAGLTGRAFATSVAVPGRPAAPAGASEKPQSEPVAPAPERSSEDLRAELDHLSTVLGTNNEEVSRLRESFEKARAQFSTSAQPTASWIESVDVKDIARGIRKLVAKTGNTKATTKSAPPTEERT